MDQSNQELIREDMMNRIREESVAFVVKDLPGSLAQTAASYGVFFTATRPCYIKAITESHTTAGADAGAVSLEVERLTGTTAPGSGTSLQSAVFDLKGTANTTQYAGLRTGSTLIAQTGLNMGDRLALKKTGTLTSLEGVQVTVELRY